MAVPKKKSKPSRAAKAASKKPAARKPSSKAAARPKRPTKAAGKTRPARQVSVKPPVRTTMAKPGAARTIAVKAAIAPPTIPIGKIDSGLTKKEIEQYRALLLQKRAQMAGDMKTLRDEALGKNRQDAAGDLSNMPLHMADLGTDNYEQEFALGLIESERAILREIDEALDRIRKGVYGVCAATGQPIGKARLNATPWAKFCYDYVLAQERNRLRGRA